MVMRVGIEDSTKQDGKIGFMVVRVGSEDLWENRVHGHRLGIEDSAKQDGKMGFMVVRVGSEDLWENRVHGHEGGQ